MSIYKTPVYVLVFMIVLLILLIVGYLYYSLFNYKLMAIKAGLEDEQIKEEYKQSTGKFSKLADILSIIITLVIFFFFAVSLYAEKNDNSFKMSGIGSLQVVASGSMSYIDDVNDYLLENNLTNQFNTYDIINIKPVESVETLKLYDVVVYKTYDKLVVHRIVDIIEKDGERQFILRGDTNKLDDPHPVAFKDIVGRYTGFKIPMVGIFVLFLQSALGYVAMGLVFMIELIAPVFEKKIDKVIKQRLQEIGYVTE